MTDKRKPGITTGKHLNESLGALIRTKITPVYTALQMQLKGQELSRKILTICYENIQELTAISELPEISQILYDSKMAKNLNKITKLRFGK